MKSAHSLFHILTSFRFYWATFEIFVAENMITLKINNSWTVAASHFNCKANIPFLERSRKRRYSSGFFNIQRSKPLDLTNLSLLHLYWNPTKLLSARRYLVSQPLFKQSLANLGVHNFYSHIKALQVLIHLLNLRSTLAVVKKSVIIFII